MAKTEKNIRGKVGNTVFYWGGDETRVRGTPENYLNANIHEQQRAAFGCGLPCVFTNVCRELG